MRHEERSFSYRPHLDGLRAVAVLLVFVFHANKGFLRGGFIGVDVFFVLSGYLITRVILRRIDEHGSLDLADFYGRRARRLLPALFLVVATIGIREAIWGSILDAATRAREVVATLLYAANWNLISIADDYFAAEGNASPLRHMWSLAVEEQFYVIYPLLLLGAVYIARRRRSAIPVILGGLAVTSVALMAALYSPLNPVRSYYGTFTRAHQLLIGALLGYAFHRGFASRAVVGRRSQLVATLVGSVSLVGLLVLAEVVRGTTSFYSRGGSLLVAVIAAALIAATELVPHSALARLLSIRPAVALGAISYGFYLWHWPIILWMSAPASATFFERRVVNAAQFILSIAVSYASYRLVEMPIRERKGILKRWSARQTVAVGLSLSLVSAGVFGLVILPINPSIPPVAQPSALEMSADLTDITASEVFPDTKGFGLVPLSTSERDALIGTATTDRSYEPCADNPRPCVKYEPGSNPDIPTVVLIGDSTAQAYDPALKLLAEQYGFRYVQAAVGGCPLSNRLIATGSGGELHKASNFMCFEEIPKIYQEVLDKWDPELFLATSWNETNQHVEDGVLIEAGTREHHEAVESGLRDVIDQLTKRANLVFIDVLPGGPSVTCLEGSEPGDAGCNRVVEPDSREKGYNAITALLASEYDRVSSVGLTDIVCPNSSCPLVIGGVVIRYDGGHFTATASRLLAPILDQRLRESGIDLNDVGGLR